MEYLSKSPDEILLMWLNVIKSQSWQGRKGNLWQGPALSHWCTHLLKQGTQSLFVGMLRH